MEDNEKNIDNAVYTGGVPDYIQNDILDFVDGNGQSLTPERRQDLAAALADMYLGKTSVEDIIEEFFKKKEFSFITAFLQAFEKSVEETENTADQQQPELFPVEVMPPQPPPDYFIQQYATARKILTSQIARKLPEYANSDGSGQSHGELEINERGKPVIKFDFNSEAVSISGREFTRFDKQVHDAACTLWGNGITRFTTEQVYKAMHNLPGDANIAGVNLEAVENSLKTAVVRRITIDATEQFKKRYPKAKIIKTAKWTDYLLPMRQIELTTKMGNVISGWQMINAPAVFAYSDMLNQISTVPIKLLDTRSRVKNTPEVSLMRDYLTGRIEWIKKDNETGRTILYTTIFSECGIDESSLDKTQRKRKRDQIKSILDAFKENGYIAGYTEEKDGRAFTGVKIITEQSQRGKKQ